MELIVELLLEAVTGAPAESEIEAFDEALAARCASL